LGFHPGGHPIKTWRKRVDPVSNYRRQVQHGFILYERFETAYPAFLFSAIHVQSRTKSVFVTKMTEYNQGMSERQSDLMSRRNRT
jgi:hypothetical protein